MALSRHLWWWEIHWPPKQPLHLWTALNSKLSCGPQPIPSPDSREQICDDFDLLPPGCSLPVRSATTWTQGKGSPSHLARRETSHSLSFHRVAQKQCCFYGNHILLSPGVAGPVPHQQPFLFFPELFPFVSARLSLALASPPCFLLLLSSWIIQKMFTWKSVLQATLSISPKMHPMNRINKPQL